MAEEKFDPADTNKDGEIDAMEQALDTLLKSQTTNKNTKSTDSGSGSSVSITPKESAYSQLDQLLVKLLGRRATVKEKSSYLSGLNKLERAYASRSSSSSSTLSRSTGGSTGSSSSSSTSYAFNSNDYLLDYAQALAGNSIKAGKPLGGEAGATYNALLNYASSMGLNKADVLANTIKITKGDTDLIKIQDSMRKRAVVLYGSFADDMKSDPSLTLKDIAQDYINTMSSMLDVPGATIQLDDPTIQKALTATDASGKPRKLSVNEFSNILRDDHRFQFSSTAHKEAIDLASSFATGMGFGG